jgi:hypothetical protein
MRDGKKGQTKQLFGHSDVTGSGPYTGVGTSGISAYLGISLSTDARRPI